MHEKAHDADSVEHRDGVRIDRGMALRSLRLGLIGKADVVEFHRVPGEKRWQPFPVEYKRGKPKTNNCDKIQLCSQAICLEEMLGIAVPAGALYYGKTRHRLDVIFDESLRRETGEAATRLHVFIREGRTPFPIAMPQCDSCSLVDICMPKAVFRNNKVGEYVKKMMEMG